MEIRKLTETITEKRQRDDSAAQIAKLEADQDYIAMMMDIDLGDEADEADETDEVEEEGEDDE